MGCTPVERMADLLPKLEGANRRLAEWFLNAMGSGKPLPLGHNSNTIAKAVGVSRATVIRFARTLGYDGFASFRNALFQHAGVAVAENDALNKPAGLKDITSLHAAALTDSLQLINSQAFAEAVSWLAGTSFVLWIGWGDSYFVAASGEHKCRLAGMLTRSANDVADLGLHVAALPADALIVVVSQSGRWQAIADALQMARERGIRVICLTGNAGSTLAHHADITFITVNPTFRVAGHPFTLRSAQTALIDALIIEAARRAGKCAVEPPGILQVPS